MRNPKALQALLTQGHTDVHYRGADEVPSNIDKMRDVFYNNDEYEYATPDDATVAEQVKRVAQECIPASHFVDKNTALIALSETMLTYTREINNWLNREYSEHINRIRLTVDMGTYIGTGIDMHANEYATTAATIVLSRIPTYIDGERIPFSVVTMYPNITGLQQVGMLAATGRNFGVNLAQEINQAPLAQKMYWQLREQGENVRYDRQASAALCYASCEGLNYRVKYNYLSGYGGALAVADPNRTGVYMPLRAAEFLTKEIGQAIRADEQLRSYPALANAKDAHSTPMQSDSPLFEPREQGVVLDGKNRDIEEISARDY